jgi:hypothetical protein
MVQHGEPVVVTAVQVERASGGHPIRDQHGTIDSRVRMPAMPIFFSLIVRRRQRMCSRSLSEKRRCPEGFRYGRMSPSCSYRRMVGTEMPRIRAAVPMEYHRSTDGGETYADWWANAVRGIYSFDWQILCQGERV